MQNVKSKTRIVYLDVLRVVSIIGVIAIHTAATELMDFSTFGDSSWWYANVLNAFVRFAVPVFFMLSGVLILSSPKTANISSFLTSRVLKIGIPFLIWSVIYSFIKETYILGHSITLISFLKTIFINLLTDQSYYHLWFIYDIFIMYLISPLLKKLVDHCSDQEMTYWLGLWFIATTVYLSIQQFTSIIGGSDAIYIHILNIPFVFGLSGYYILGYYLNTKQFSKKFKTILYSLGLLSIGVTIFGTYIISSSQNALNETLYANLSLPTFLTALALFIWAKDVDWNNRLTDSFQNLLSLISDASLGIYLIHIVVIIKLSSTLNFILPVSFILYLVAMIVLTFAFSFFLVKLIRLIPVIGKYLV
ncbi:MAG: acyltransferase [Cellulosilyticaceae bacterium]